MARARIDVLSELLPWGNIVSFLPLHDLLSCRLVSPLITLRIHESVLPEYCHRWWEAFLQQHNLYFISGNVDRNWKNASNKTSDEIGDDDAKNEIVSLFATATMTTTTTTTTPLDCLLRCCRVGLCIPHEAGVAFSGKYGRHIVSLTEQSDIECHDPCPKGRKNCPTCRVSIPCKAIDVATDRSTQGFNDGDNHEDDGSDDADEDSSNQSSLLLSLDDILQIRVRGGGILDLDRYYNKCVPNLPADLYCPMCRDNSQRTLLLTEMTYLTSPETARGARDNWLSFTPLMDDDNDYRQRRRKRRRRHPIQMDVASFPPMQSCFFLPGHNDLELPFTRYKHALAIHCTSCRKFGIVAPAGICYGRGPATNDCRGKFSIGDRYGSSIGGILCRRVCSMKTCQNALACGPCRSRSQTPYCPSCFQHNEALQLHA